MLPIFFLLLVGCGEENPFAKDDDGDGFSEFDGDCNDNNPDIFPTHLKSVTKLTTIVMMT